ncbi:hypothetical protein LTR04_001458 [Oleoguttula sp. CCFEE 6159]|nr:hypothetical protein LTR04_001458 [Oleoguttula sp. CCFEE 6159]
MRVAEILADLTSLRACDPAAALALVSARPPLSTSSTASANNATAPTTNAPPTPSAPIPNTDPDLDPDIQRAKDLLHLHYTVKVAHQRGGSGSGGAGFDRELVAAREAVERAVRALR